MCVCVCVCVYVCAYSKAPARCGWGSPPSINTHITNHHDSVGIPPPFPACGTHAYTYTLQYYTLHWGLYVTTLGHQHKYTMLCTCMYVWCVHTCICNGIRNTARTTVQVSRKQAPTCITKCYCYWHLGWPVTGRSTRSV